MSTRTSTKILALLFAGLLLPLISPAVATAAEGTQASETLAAPIVVSGQLIPDCEHFSARARAYALAHNITVCGVGSTTPPGGVSAYNTVFGECGSSTILLTRAGGRAYTVGYGFQSNLGPVILRALLVSVALGNSAGGFADASAMLAPTYGASRVLTASGYGTIYASLDGTATLAWGLVCYLKGPKATLKI